MKELIHQTRSALAAGLYYLALLGALALPDICGALASDNGKASGSKYKGWLRDNVPEQASNADLIWGLRCSLWHQGSAASHKGSMPIAFMFPSPQVPQLHNLSTEVNGQQVGWCSIPLFVEEVTRGAERWLSDFGGTRTVSRNLDGFARLRLEGLPPHVAGAPVIA